MGGTIMSGSNDLVLVQPDDRQVREVRRTDRLDISSSGGDNSDGRIAARKGKRRAAGREGHAVNPSSRAVRELAAHDIERKLLTPRRRSGPNYEKGGVVSSLLRGFELMLR